MAAKTKKEKARIRRVKAQLRAQAGLDRKAFFADGGEMVRWRGLHLVQGDRKKQANKSRCRQKVRY